MKQSNLAFSAAALAASLTLTACGNSAAGEANAAEGNASNQASARADRPLPPSILKSRTYRCRDNSVVYVDFFTDNTAAVRTEQTGMPTKLQSQSGNPPFTADGWSVSANAEQAEIALPGKAGQSCRASS
jgi:hypothetical protein